MYQFCGYFELRQDVCQTWKLSWAVTVELKFLMTKVWTIIDFVLQDHPYSSELVSSPLLPKITRLVILVITNISLFLCLSLARASTFISACFSNDKKRIIACIHSPCVHSKRLVRQSSLSESLFYHFRDVCSFSFIAIWELDYLPNQRTGQRENLTS